MACVASASLGACDAPSVPLDAAAECASDADCDDGLFCNGPERCAPGTVGANRLGCAAAAEPACSLAQVCEEAERRCTTQCELTGDADGDGHDAIECGGDDCDDADATRFPGAVEVCDPGHDEDCDPLTLGDRDADGDGHIDALCCNGDVCGDDCDDTRANQHPTASEVCDGIDNDCNGVLDGPLEDRDRDGFVDPSCGGTDCDDERTEVHPGAVELCDGVDTDCDGSPFDDEADLDGDGFVTSTTCVSATLRTGDCDDTRAEASPDGAEACNARDDDCDGLVDEGLTDCDGVVEIATGRNHTCALRQSGAVECWGIGEALGTGRAVQSYRPVPVEGLDRAIDVAAGEDVTCAVRDDGSVWCWGQQREGALGNGATAAGVSLAPVRVMGLPDDVVEVESGALSSCARTAGGEVWCWGDNSDGQLGDGTTTDRATAVRVLGIDDAVGIARGTVAAHTCAVRAGGTIACWGDNRYGQLGDGTMADSAVPVAVSGLTGVVEVRLADAATCARTADLSVWCWGRNEEGQLGDDTRDTRPAPVRVVMLPPAVRLAAGFQFACAGHADGAVSCWGNGVNGSLGDRTTTTRARPGPVHGLEDAVQLDASVHACALRADGSAVCWGDARHGQLGDGSAAFRATPFDVAGITDAVALDVGYDHACAVRAGGEVRCWGGNEYGQLGDGGTVNALAPVTVSGLAGARVLATGVLHSCAGTDTGAWCWGRDFLGTGARGGSTTPVAVTSLGAVASMAAGDLGTCVLDAAGARSCWGESVGADRFGLGVTGSQLAPFADPGGPYDGVAVGDRGSGRACALRAADGALLCWTETASESPPGAFLQVDAFQHVCAVRTDGLVACWGQNAFGRLGADPAVVTIATAAAPVVVAGVTDAVAVTVARLHTCALRAGGGVRCWGDATDGRLGHGSTARNGNWVPPTDVEGVTDAVEVAAGDRGACARRASGVVSCWGYDYYGGCGSGLGANQRNEPVPAAGLP